MKKKSALYYGSFSDESYFAGRVLLRDTATSHVRNGVQTEIVMKTECGEKCFCKHIFWQRCPYLVPLGYRVYQDISGKIARKNSFSIDKRVAKKYIREREINGNYIQPNASAWYS